MCKQFAWWVIIYLVSVAGTLSGQPAAAAEENGEPDAQPAATAQPIKQPGTNLVRLTKDYPIWIDPQRKLVVIDGEICLREGMLEMFACPRNTKEHESIVAVHGRAQYVHAGLLAVGAEPGRPVQFHPEYSPATGTIIDVFVLWIDQDGQRRAVRAQDWIRYHKTDQPMPHDWVFAGSGFWVDEHTGERLYYGDGGDFICVSNFATATLDLPVPSPQDNADLLFSALTENIPPLGTKVRLVLRPRLEP
jgi:hypothetical protein